MTCPECKGTRWHLTQWTPTFRIRWCERCDATGVVPDPPETCQTAYSKEPIPLDGKAWDGDEP